MPILGRNYPKLIYGNAIFKFGNYLAKTKEMRGLFAYLPPSQILRGQNAKSSSPLCSVGQATPRSYMGSHVWGRGHLKFKFRLNFEFEKEMKKKTKGKEKKALAHMGFLGRQGPIILFSAQLATHWC